MSFTTGESWDCRGVTVWITAVNCCDGLLPEKCTHISEIVIMDKLYTGFLTVICADVALHKAPSRITGHRVLCVAPVIHLSDRIYTPGSHDWAWVNMSNPRVNCLVWMSLSVRCKWCWFVPVLSTSIFYNLTTNQLSLACCILLRQTNDPNKTKRKVKKQNQTLNYCVDKLSELRNRFLLQQLTPIKYINIMEHWLLQLNSFKHIFCFIINESIHIVTWEIMDRYQESTTEMLHAVNYTVLTFTSIIITGLHWPATILKACGLFFLYCDGRGKHGHQLWCTVLTRDIHRQQYIFTMLTPVHHNIENITCYYCWLIGVKLIALIMENSI